MEHRLLQRTAEAWQNLLIEIAGKEAKKPVQLQNPYRAGDPVTGSHFFDREQILNVLRTRTETGQSLSLIGHRRSGKTSILMELASRETKNYLATYLTMERLGVATDAQELVYSILQAISGRCREWQLAPPPLPALAEFSTNLLPTVEQFFQELLSAAWPRHLILCLDEYELLEEEMDKGNYLQRTMLAFLRTIRANSKLSVVVAGRAGPIELQKRFQHPIFADLEPQWVDLLSEADARQLITNPVSDFPVNYEGPVVEQICRLTAGQPYLIQQICKDLIDELQEEVRRERDREWLIRTGDLESVLGARHFEKASFYYYKVWQEVGEVGRAVLQSLATDDNRGRSRTELVALVNGCGNLEAVLQELEHQRIVEYQIQEDRYSFRIPLMSGWVGYHLRNSLAVNR